MEKSKKLRNGKIAIIVFAAAILLFSVYLIAINYNINKEQQTIEKGWQFSINGKVTKSQPGDRLEEFVFPAIKKGDVIELEKVLGCYDLHSPEMIFLYLA